MDQINIPHDIRRTMTFRHIRLAVLSAVWYTALVVSVLSFRYYIHTEGIPTANLTVFVLIFAAVPFFYFKIYRIFTEHTYTGVVESVELVYRPMPAEGKIFRLRDTECCDVVIRSEKGFKHAYSFPDYTGKNDLYRYYHTGDRVCHLKFMRVPYNLNNDESFSVICVNCGTLDLQNRETCFK